MSDDEESRGCSEPSTDACLTTLRGMRERIFNIFLGMDDRGKVCE